MRLWSSCRSRRAASCLGDRPEHGQGREGGLRQQPQYITLHHTAFARHSTPLHSTLVPSVRYPLTSTQQSSPPLPCPPLTSTDASARLPASPTASPRFPPSPSLVPAQQAASWSSSRSTSSASVSSPPTWWEGWAEIVGSVPTRERKCRGGLGAANRLQPPPGASIWPYLQPPPHPADRHRTRCRPAAIRLPRHDQACEGKGRLKRQVCVSYCYNQSAAAGRDGADLFPSRPPILMQAAFQPPAPLPSAPCCLPASCAPPICPMLPHSPLRLSHLPHKASQPPDASCSALTLQPAAPTCPC